MYKFIVTFFLISILSISAFYYSSISYKKEILETNKKLTNDNLQKEVKIEVDKENILKYKVKAPDFIGLENWINSSEIKSIEELKGKVVLIDFWTYSCINCIRVLPYVQDLHEKYSDKGLVVIGIHTPEFSYEKKLENLKKNVEKRGLTYSVAQDNDYKTWRNFKNRYWPSLYLIDKDGNIRYKHFGEGNYDKNEQAVKLLLEEI